MFSYEFYKVIHFASILAFVVALGFSFSTTAPAKWTKIMIGVAGVLIFVAGMGLLARLDIGHGDDPSWPIVGHCKDHFMVGLSHTFPHFK